MEHGAVIGLVITYRENSAAELSEEGKHFVAELSEEEKHLE
jgi:hypothetical protein